MINPTRTPDLEIRKVGADILVHDPAHAKVHVLNVTAGDVLALCDGTRSPSDIARSLSAATGVELTIVTRDIDAIVAEFFALELVSA